MSLSSAQPMKNGFGVLSAEAAQRLPAKIQIRLWGKHCFQRNGDRLPQGTMGSREARLESQGGTEGALT